MLVLSRQRDQIIRIGHHIKVIIADIRGDKVRIGIEAPQGLAVHREEVYQEAKDEIPDPLGELNTAIKLIEAGLINEAIASLLKVRQCL